MDQKQRAALINQLDKSFAAMPTWVKATVKHAMAAPEINPATGEKFKSFREVIEVASDECLETLRSEFEENDDLQPADS